MKANRYPYGPATVQTPAEEAAIAVTTEGNSKEFIVVKDIDQNTTITVAADASHKDGDELILEVTTDGTETVDVAGDAIGAQITGVAAKTQTRLHVFHNGKFRAMGQQID